MMGAFSLRFCCITAFCTVGSLGQSCTTVITQFNYGEPPPSGVHTFCTNAPASQYGNNQRLWSRHQAPQGYRLTLQVAAWKTEASKDFGIVYAAPRNAAPALSASCTPSIGAVLNSSSGPLAPLPGLWESGYGAQIGLCFYSDASGTNTGIVYNVSSTACPAGSYCPNNATAPIVCAAGRFSTKGATACAPCPGGTYSNAGASVCCAEAFEEQAAACAPCSAGYFCPPSNGIQRTPCAAGTYSSSFATACSACAAGF